MSNPKKLSLQPHNQKNFYSKGYGGNESGHAHHGADKNRMSLLHVAMAPKNDFVPRTLILVYYCEAKTTTRGDDAISKMDVPKHRENQYANEGIQE